MKLYGKLDWYLGVCNTAVIYYYIYNSKGVCTSHVMTSRYISTTNIEYTTKGRERKTKAKSWYIHRELAKLLKEVEKGRR